MLIFAPVIVSRLAVIHLMMIYQTAGLDMNYYDNYNNTQNI